jgi:hypothetical protein
MNRRDFIFTGLAASLLSTSALVPAALAAGRIQVIYVGGLDCPYCTMWRKEYEKEWRASPYIQQVQWIEVDVPHLREAYQARYWTGELQAIRDQLPRKSGTPRFIVVRDGKVVSSELGVNRWEDTVSLIRTLLG